MKKIIVIVIILFIFLFVINRKNNSPLYISEEKAISIYEKQPNIPEIDLIIKKINASNVDIKTFSCQNFKIELTKGVKFNLTGSVFMEKNNKFRMTIYNQLGGKELDAGSNDAVFWFWSKRIRPNLNQQKQNEPNQFKSYINPNWLILCMSFNEIDLKKSEIIKYKDFYGIIQTQPYGRVLILIDPKKQLVIGHYLYDNYEKLISSAEIISFQQVGKHTIPKQISIILHQENTKIMCFLDGAVVNSRLSRSYWSMPRSFP